MLLEAALAAGGDEVVVGDSGSDIEDISKGFPVVRLNFCPCLVHVKLDVSNDGVYSLRHLVTNEIVALKEGKEYEIRHLMGTWRVTTTCSGTGEPLGNYFDQELRYNESTNFIDVLRKSTGHLAPVKPETLPCVSQYMRHML